MDHTEPSLELQDALDEINLDERDTPRSPTLSTSPSEQLPPHHETQSEWREPEAGFTQINLNDSPRPDLDRSQSQSQSPSIASSDKSHTPPLSPPTTTAPSSPPSSLSTSEVATPGAAAGEATATGTASGMSKPPDSTKVQLPSPPSAKKAQQTAKSPSMMQRVVSMTRQRDLPPKSKEEEVRLTFNP